MAVELATASESPVGVDAFLGFETNKGGIKGVRDCHVMTPKGPKWKPGHNIGRPKGSKSKTPTMADLRDKCLETLLQETPEGDALVSEVLQKLAKLKPDKFAEFAAKLLPRDIGTQINVQTTAPIVFDLD